jgi:hypothetical protein
MPKYDVPEDHWENDEPETPPRWRDETSAQTIEIEVQLHNDGYQTDKKWTVHASDRIDEDSVIAGYAIEHRNKGNYWREGDRWGDAIDFVDLPLRARRRVAHVLNRDLSEITPEARVIYRDDGTGIAQRRDGGDSA